ncbi:hypothetical protein U9M48_021281 [Paspalum notatum var. saurae]|uniref:Uncharacterized protein n=1 Tax=Paspalum notatum var. saurae TaxID=547442 RepID=A0AAQ3TFZ9_PASNO
MDQIKWAEIRAQPEMMMKALAAGWVRGGGPFRSPFRAGHAGGQVGGGARPVSLAGPPSSRVQTARAGEPFSAPHHVATSIRPAAFGSSIVHHIAVACCGGVGRQAARGDW